VRRACRPAMAASAPQDALPPVRSEAGKGDRGSAVAAAPATATAAFMRPTDFLRRNGPVPPAGVRFVARGAAILPDVVSRARKRIRPGVEWNEPTLVSPGRILREPEPGRSSRVAGPVSLKRRAPVSAGSCHPASFPDAVSRIPRGAAQTAVTAKVAAGCWLRWKDDGDRSRSRPRVPQSAPDERWSRESNCRSGS
jgi:hypothetical protein